MALSIGVREVAEFGPMAGLAGAALAVAVWCHQQLKYVCMHRPVKIHCMNEHMHSMQSKCMHVPVNWQVSCTLQNTIHETHMTPTLAIASAKLANCEN